MRFAIFHSEVLQDPIVSARLMDTKATTEVRALEDFYVMMQTDPQRAFYGLIFLTIHLDFMAIIIHFENVTFSHAKLWLDVCLQGKEPT